ncbi:MAG: hypothetical protein QOG53_2859 [Frankiales bacterium]|jgi:SAM-dependent MidA family methyltransferase|nr:hypothetical protein [Frankiales bacterium]
MGDALYGARGFYRSPEGPAGHFRTSAQSTAFAAAVRRLATQVDQALGSPATFDLVDVGAGRGELLSALADTVPHHWRLTGVEVADRPPTLRSSIDWRSQLPERITGVVVANEWLDNIPIDVAVLTPLGPRLVLVDDDGTETVGGRLDPNQNEWLRTWWPLRVVGDRAEIGLPRDQAWAQVVAALDRGVAVAIDYAHGRDKRPPDGTLIGYQRGHVVPPVPDGLRDVTAHVALDAVAATGVSAGATDGIVLTQRRALQRFGIAGRRPRRADGDASAYLRALSLAGTEAELLDPHGLGGFTWLMQSKGVRLP